MYGENDQMLKIDGVRIGLILVPKCASTSIKAALEDDNPVALRRLTKHLTVAICDLRRGIFADEPHL